ncbi:MAG: nucleotide exchange factor GrpE [Planctomycetota bacterium]|jgi:molecular chaperone GrpE
MTDARQADELDTDAPRPEAEGTADEATLEEIELGADEDENEALPDDLDEVDALRLELAETVSKWQRAQADYQNLKRRTQTDVENRLRRTMEPLLRNLLLVLDHLDMALMSPTESQDAKNLAIGVEMVRKQMMTALEESDVEPIEERGAFDPELHQAVGEVQSEEHEPGTIVETVRRGYRWRGRALRHGEVRVAAAQDGEQEAEADQA